MTLHCLLILQKRSRPHSVSDHSPGGMKTTTRRRSHLGEVGLLGLVGQLELDQLVVDGRLAPAAQRLHQLQPHRLTHDRVHLATHTVTSAVRHHYVTHH